MNPYFYVLYPENECVKTILNAIRIIADENQRSQIHITVRGPYIKRLNRHNVKTYSSLIENQDIEIVGVGNFFDSEQNTVFFECSNPILKKIWNKSTYKEFNPHMTIYDGKNDSFARQIYDVLVNQFRPFNFKTKELSLLEPKGQIEFERLNTSIDFKKISDILQCNIDLSIIKKMSLEERLKYITMISNILFIGE